MHLSWAKWETSWSTHDYKMTEHPILFPFRTSCFMIWAPAAPLPPSSLIRQSKPRSLAPSLSYRSEVLGESLICDAALPHVSKVLILSNATERQTHYEVVMWCMLWCIFDSKKAPQRNTQLSEAEFFLCLLGGLMWLAEGRGEGGMCFELCCWKQISLLMKSLGRNTKVFKVIFNQWKVKILIWAMKACSGRWLIIIRLQDVVFLSSSLHPVWNSENRKALRGQISHTTSRDIDFQPRWASMTVEDCLLYSSNRALSVL